MATYIIGDVQGCFEPLQRLLDSINFDKSADHLYFVGDLVNRGPQSYEVLKFCYQHKACITTVLGNHDLNLLAIHEGIRKPNPKDTLDVILDAPDRQLLLNWLRNQPLIHYDNARKLFISHAGFFPFWSLEENIQYGHELENVIQGKSYLSFLENMYGNEPNTWAPDLSGPERWRFICNAFTRMRFITKHHSLNLDYKGDLENSPKDLAPWFTFLKQPQPFTVFFGHWAALMGKTGRDDIIGLDTGCVWGKALTAYNLDSNKIEMINQKHNE